MSLTAEQRARTREELRANFGLSGVPASQAARALGLTEQQLEDALDMAPSVHPADIWTLRDYLEREVLARGEAPVPFTVLTAKARMSTVRWFTTPGAS
ncbi:DUF2316 family protein [Actinoplanes sp. G11-F43]|uniref:DUF2316 family protein n=1 Tax=Actinoplanes sp. G11-F43 TaxID=3424130 RepID=UPI003D34E975